MTFADLRDIEERAEKATKGPWGVNPAGHTVHVLGADGQRAPRTGMRPCGDMFPHIAGAPHEADAEFIAHSRTDIPALVAFVRGLARAAIDTTDGTREPRVRCRLCMAIYRADIPHPRNPDHPCPLSGWSVADLEEKP